MTTDKKPSKVPRFLTHPDPSIYTRGRGLFLDFENTVLDKGSWLNKSNRILMASWVTADGYLKTKWGGETDLQELLDDIAEADFVVAHNIKHELGWLERCGANLRKIIPFCTMIAEWVIGGNRWSQLQLLGLEMCLARRGLQSKDIAGKLIKRGVDTRSIPGGWLSSYCDQDVLVMRNLFYSQLRELTELGLLHIQYARCLLTPVLVDMESQGLKLNRERVKEEYDKANKEYAELQAELDRIAGGINFRSKPQLAEFLYDKLKFKELTRYGKPLRTKPSKKFPDGQRKTDADTLEKLVATNKKQREFTDLVRKLSKVGAKLTKALNHFNAVCENHDGIFYGIFNQGTTTTHRLSSSGRNVVLPNQSGKGKPKTASAQLQNIAREFKKLFRAKRDDWYILEADGSQLEFRVAAELAADPVAIDEIVNDKDVHSITAQTLTDAGEPTDRQDAKEYTFRPLFGGSSGTPAVEAYCEFFKTKYDGITREQQKWISGVARTKQQRTKYGMIFYFPDTRITGSGYVINSTKISNYSIQGLSTGEIIPIALVWLWHMLDGWDTRLVLTVHDSVIAESPEDELEPIKPILADCFTVRVYETLDKLYNYQFKNVPLAVGIKIGKHWSEGKEITATVFPDDRGNVIWKTKK
jgi:DNA polymerase I